MLVFFPSLIVVLCEAGWFFFWLFFPLYGMRGAEWLLFTGKALASFQTVFLLFHPYTYTVRSSMIAAHRGSAAFFLPIFSLMYLT